MSIEDRWFQDSANAQGENFKKRTERHGVGLRWRVRYRTPEGAARSKSFAKKGDADQFAIGVGAAKIAGTFVDPARAKVTVKVQAEKWLASKVNVKPSTLARYTDIVETHIVPRWGAVQLARVDHEDIQAWVAELGTSGKQSGASARKILGVFSGIMQLAVRAKRLNGNPVTGIELPSAASAPRRYLTMAQVEVLATSAGDQTPGRPRRRGDEVYAQYRLVVLVLAYCGLRWSELAALQTSSVNLMTRRIHVTRAVVEVDGASLVWGTTKTGKERRVPIPAFLVDELRDHLAGRDLTDLAFTAPDGGVLRNRNARRAWFDRAATETGVPGLTPHELRHTAASLAVSAGANVKAVQGMLGHKSAVMTLDTYADLFDDDLEVVGERLDAMRTAAGVSQKCPKAPVVELRPTGGS